MENYVLSQKYDKTICDYYKSIRIVFTVQFSILP